MKKVSFPVAFLLIFSLFAHAIAVADDGIFFEDPLQKKLKDGWTWLREVPDHWRITDNALEIKMEPRSGDNVRNILFRKPPKKDAGSFDVTVDVKALRPYTNQYQQAGLFWMQEDKTKLKFVMELIDGQLYVFPGKKPLQTEHVVLRLRIDGTKVVGEYQPDAKGEFFQAFEGQLPERNDATDQIALQCWHGPADAETWIRFQNFSIKKPGTDVGSAVDEDADKVRQLTVEVGRLTQQVQNLQEDIRTQTKMIAELGSAADVRGSLGGGFAQSESLLRDVYLAEAQLTALEAKRKASQKRMEQPGDIPIGVFQQFHPEFQTLNAQLDALRLKKEELKQFFRSTDDPTIQRLDQQIASINARLGNINNSTDDEVLQGIFKLMQLNEQMNQWNLEQEIRIMQLMVSELREKYQQQLLLNSDRSAGTAAGHSSECPE